MTEHGGEVPERDEAETAFETDLEQLVEDAEVPRETVAEMLEELVRRLRASLAAKTPEAAEEARWGRNEEYWRDGED